MRWTGAVWCAVLAAAPCAAVAQGGEPLAPDSAAVAVVLASLEARLAADVAADGVGSIAAAVVLGDSVMWRGAFGVASRETGAPATAATVYRIGSISKSVTALVLLALVERGVVSLDEPVAPHLPELGRLANLEVGARPITFGDLAGHTAGLAREPASSGASRGLFREWKWKVVGAIPSTEILAEAGERHVYSNIGYGLLGFALERAAGRSYERLVQELVLEPLGMRDSWLVVPTAARRRLAAGYVNPAPDSVDPRVPRAEHHGRGYRVPGEGLYSTLDDMARLAMAMTGALGDVPVSEPLRTLALTDRGDGYGLGFQLHRIGDMEVAGHSGTIPGYTAYLAVDPETGAGVVLLRNYNQGATNLGATAVRVLLGLRDGRERAHDDPAAAAGPAVPRAPSEP